MSVSDEKFIQLISTLSAEDKQELYEILLIMVKYRKLKEEKAVQS